MTTKTVRISFDRELLKAIDHVAKQESCSRSGLIQKAAHLFIQRRERLARIFDVGQGVAGSRGLKPADIEREITAHRRSHRIAIPPRRSR